jgi:site-specific recombinase XerD
MTTNRIRIDCPAGFDGYPRRRTVYLPSKQQAASLKNRIKAWKAARRAGHATPVVTQADLDWLGYLKTRLGDLTRLPLILDAWQHAAEAVRERIRVDDLCAAFIEFKTGDTSNPRTLADIRYRVNQFSWHFRDRYADEITTPELREYLQTIREGYSRRNAYKWLRPMFDFAKERHHVAANPFDTIDRPSAGRTEPGIYTPEDYEQLLRTADTQFPALVPFLACSGLAGLRTAELVSMYANEETLEWPDVLFDKRLIVVRGQVAKQTSRETGDKRFVPMEPALIDWLTPFRKDSGPVVPMTESWFRKQLRRLHVASGVPPVANGLRHGFASYWLARTGAEGVGRLAVVMGNSEAVARKHYIETLQPGDGDRWFGVRRA